MSSGRLGKIKGKTFLITGGTGSFGTEMLKTLLELHPKKIIIFSRDEKKQHDMRNMYDSPLLKFVIGDVRDFYSLDRIVQGVDYIFHAAALKQVPTCEFFPMEALKTNVLGAENVINSAIKNGVAKVVVLSTDKAVYPINVIGMTKALMEKVMIAEVKIAKESKKSKTILCGVRYGNVLCTRGSVIPHFIDQILQNKTLTVTNKDMTRFLLPLSDAIELVLYVLAKGENGHIYVRKSPACTLGTLADAVCAIFNYRKGYSQVGIRAGEKMHETLIGVEELLRAVNVRSYYKVPPESQGLDYNKYFYQGKKSKTEKNSAFTSENTKRLDVKEVTEMLLKLPEIKGELKAYKQKKLR